MNHDIFISYSRKDSAIVDEFVHLIEQEGFRVWIDRDGIESGDAFKRVIVMAIKESALVVYFSSASSNASSWTAKEISIAVHHGKPIIPIKLDKTVYNDEVEFDLVGLDYIDYTDLSSRDAMRSKLLRTLKAKLPKRWEEICALKSKTQQNNDSFVKKEEPPREVKKEIVSVASDDAEKPKNYLILIVVVSLLCLVWYLGIPAFVNGYKVDKLWLSGDREEAKRASEKAKKWLLLPVIVGAFAYLIMIITSIG